MRNPLKKLTFRIQNFLFYIKLPPEPEPGYSWKLPHHGPTDLPIGMTPWAGNPEEARTMTEEMNPTITIPRVSIHHDVIAYGVERSSNDAEATYKAATALRNGNLDAVLEGLRRYANLDPVADTEMMPA